MLSLSSRAKRAALATAFAATLLLLPASSFAKCNGVHHGAKLFGWNKIFSSDAWPYYEKNRGAIRLNGAQNTDQVFVNGCDAGQASKLQPKFFLDPGSYSISVKSSNGNQVFSRQLSVSNGQVIDLNIGAK